jgi:two-component system nitrogen regulation sensor histidine kinase NtrY
LAAPNPIRDEPKTLRPPQGRNRAGDRRFLLLAILVSQASFNLKFISPDSNQELLFFAGLSGLIFFAFVALTLVLGRNLLKLYAERRQGVAGSKFRTRLVVVSLLLSFLPVIAMFWFSYGLMNRSIDKWFSQPVEEVRADTAAMSALLYDYAGQNAASEAQSIAQTDEFQRAFASGNFSEATEELREHIPTLQGGFVLALANGNAAASLNTSGALGRHEGSASRCSGVARRAPPFSVGSDGLHCRGGFASWRSVSRRHAASAKIRPNRQADSGQPEALHRTGRQKKTVSADLYRISAAADGGGAVRFDLARALLSKLVNRPVAALAAGTEAISKGQLDYRVDIRATDELAELVQSFNSMAEQLESSRHQIEASSRDVGARTRRSKEDAATSKRFSKVFRRE